MALRHCFSFRFVQILLHNEHHLRYLSSYTKKPKMSNQKKTNQPSISYEKFFLLLNLNEFI